MKKLINHVALVIDNSPSMGHLVRKTIEVVNSQVRGFQAVSGQDTHLSIYTFGGTCVCEQFDIQPKFAKDARFFVTAMNPATALMDAVDEVIRDLKGIHTVRGDHSYLIYVITDGEDNASLISAAALKRKIERLNDDWTIGVMVPDIRGKHHAKQFGLPADNIEIWDATSEKGMEEVGQKVQSTYTAYSMGRSLGFKSTKCLFKPNDVTKTEVVRKLDEIPPSEYQTLLVRERDDGKPIKDFVEKLTGDAYRVGSAYYQLSKPEVIQAGKVLAVIEHSTGKMFSGTNARKILGLPHQEVKVAPGDHTKFDVFVQSTSTNRKLVADTHLVVFK